MSKKDTSNGIRKADEAPFWTVGDPLPVFVNVEGTVLAIIPIDDYKRMMTAVFSSPEGRRDEGQRSYKRRSPPEGLSTIERDPEVAEFILSRFRGGVTVQQVQDACLNIFGADRTPSKSRIQRFRERLKRCR